MKNKRMLSIGKFNFSPSLEQTPKALSSKNNFNIWQGPIVGQDGQLVLQNEAVADDRFLGSMKFYVKGVVGKVPS